MDNLELDKTSLNPTKKYQTMESSAKNGKTKISASISANSK